MTTAQTVLHKPVEDAIRALGTRVAAEEHLAEMLRHATPEVYTRVMSGTPSKEDEGDPYVMERHAVRTLINQLYPPAPSVRTPLEEALQSM
jgi:5'-deoxynucleotidase YfbR-like HD superfamily hydrolase